MSAVVQRTADALQSELDRARTALKEIHPNVAPTLPEDATTTGAMAVYRNNLLSQNPELFAGTSRLTLKDLGLVNVHEVAETPDTVPPPQKEDPPKRTPHRASLEGVLTNTLILDHLMPLLTVSSIMALTATSKTLRSLIRETPYVFRHLDLTTCRGADVPDIAPIDVGGEVWRSERMDESITEEEFYAGPLRGIFSRLERQSILPTVRTLVLDGLSVPAELVSEILLSDRFNVNILSIRECKNLNERRLMQALQYAVRPGRPVGTPRVRGIYHFTPRQPPRIRQRTSRREWWKAKSAGRPPPEPAKPVASNGWEHLNEWYQPYGRVIGGTIEEGWAQTLQKCEGIIAFDAVLCRGPRHNADLYSSSNTTRPRPEERFLPPAIATVALGPRGCDGCRTCPEGPAIWPESPEEQFPLLSPPPLHSSKVVDAKRPVARGETAVMIARCKGCLQNRWCHRCQKWFCFQCLPHPEEVSVRLSLHQTATRGPRDPAEERRVCWTLLRYEPWC